jgi:hypothetical protein
VADYIHLTGAEEVSRAASRMQSAAEEMKRAAESIGYSFETHQRFLTQWLAEYRDLLATQIGGDLGP